MEYEIQNTSNELTHWGVKGMKWGIRRYQNKDGSLTNAGKKRRAKLEAELKQLGGKKKKSTTTSKTTAEAAPRKKTLAEMSDAEIRDRINRMNLEKQYYDTRKSLAVVNPPQVSKGKKFINSVLNDVIAPAAKDAGRKWLTNFMEDKLGVNKKDPLAALEKQAKKLKATKEIEEYKREIEKIKSGKTDPYPEIKTWDDLKKSREFFDEEEKRRKGQDDE